MLLTALKVTFITKMNNLVLPASIVMGIQCYFSFTEVQDFKIRRGTIQAIGYVSWYPSNGKTFV